MPIFGNALRIHEQRSTGTHWLLVEFPILVNEIFFSLVKTPLCSYFKHVIWVLRKDGTQIFHNFIPHLPDEYDIIWPCVGGKSPSLVIYPIIIIAHHIPHFLLLKSPCVAPRFRQISIVGENPSKISEFWLVNHPSPKTKPHHSVPKIWKSPIQPTMVSGWDHSQLHHPPQDPLASSCAQLLVCGDGGGDRVLAPEELRKMLKKRLENADLMGFKGDSMGFAGDFSWFFMGYPLVICYRASENHPFRWDYRSQWAIVHYVKLPEGRG